ncbi:MAG: ArsR/SmtB family transcription factor [Phycisphaerae bacterium]
MREFLAITKALSDKTRVRALLALRYGELCLCQIIELLGLAPATVSKHVDALVRAGLVERRKEGRWCFFRLAGRGAPAHVQQILKWVSEFLETDAVMRNDARRLVHLRKMDLKDLSTCYKS